MLDKEKKLHIGKKTMRNNASNKLNSGETKTEWKRRLAMMTDEELYKHCEHYIWLSAYANNNPRSDYHFLCDAGYDECKRRERADIYAKAYHSHGV